MENRITIRPAVAEDATVWVRLKQQIHNLHVGNRPSQYTSITDDEAHTLFYQIMQEDDTQVLAAVLPTGDMVGHMVIKKMERPQRPGNTFYRYLLIDEICVDERYQRQGLGRLFIDKARDIAASEGLQEVTLFVWGFNEKAVAFYRSLGMQTDILRMSLPVEESKPL